MQRRKKQLLGLVGLVLVAVMTAIACTLPSPEASAQSGATSTVKVEVVPPGEIPTVEIVSLRNDDIEVNKTFDVQIRYAKATKLIVYVKNLGVASEIMTLADVDPNPQAGEVEISLAGTDCDGITYDITPKTCTAKYTLPGSLVGYNGVNFTTRAVAVNGNVGDASSEEIVQFMYRAAKFSGAVTYEPSSNNPIVHIAMSDDVKSGELIILDSNGQPIFGSVGDEEGKYSAIQFTGYNDTNKGKLDLTLPFKDKDLASGDYQVILLAHNSSPATEDSLIAVARADVKYNKGGGTHPGGPTDPTDPDDPSKPDNPDDPDAPEVPGTGVNLFGGLNISSADYILTGLVAFGMVTMFAIFLIVRRSKR